MSRFQRIAKKSIDLLRTQTQFKQVRHKTTSEHVMKLRGGFVDESGKSQHQLAMESQSHMNFMPVPEGPWEDYYRARNAKWSKMLIFSISALGITIYCMHVSNCFYLHTLPSRRKTSPDYEKTGKIRPYEQ